MGQGYRLLSVCDPPSTALLPARPARWREHLPDASNQAPGFQATNPNQGFSYRAAPVVGQIVDGYASGRKVDLRLPSHSRRLTDREGKLFDQV